MRNFVLPFIFIIVALTFILSVILLVYNIQVPRNTVLQIGKNPRDFINVSYSQKYVPNSNFDSDDYLTSTISGNISVNELFESLDAGDYNNYKYVVIQSNKEYSCKVVDFNNNILYLKRMDNIVETIVCSFTLSSLRSDLNVNEEEVK